MVPGHDLHAHRQAEGRLDRHRDRRVPHDVGRDRQYPVVLEPDLLVADPGVGGDVGRVGHVGVGGADDEVGLVEDGCHALVHVGPVPLDGGGHGEVVGAVGHLHAECHLLGEVVPAIGPQLAEVVGQLGEVGHRPLEAEAGELDRHVDLDEAGVADQRGGRGADVGLDLGSQHRLAEVGADHHLHARDVVGVELGLPPAVRRQGVGVPRVVPGADVVPAGHVADRAGLAALDDGQRCDLGLRATGDAAGGPLHPDQPAERRRDADRSAAVTSGRDGDEPAGDRRGGAARGAARRPALLPRVVGGAVELGGRHVEPTELRGRAHADQGGAASQQAVDHRAVDRADAVGEDEGGLGVGPPRDLVELLDAHGDAAEGP